MLCLIIQPIHPNGMAVLAEAGIEARLTSSDDMGVVAREIGSADAVLTRNCGLTREPMAAAGNARVVAVHGIGVDRVDMAYAGEIGLPVTNTPYANLQSVAELAIAHMLAIAKRVRESDRAVREERYDYRYTRDFREVSGKTLLIVGFGKIGRRTAEIARAGFGMRILVHSPRVPDELITQAGFEPTGDIDAALAVADYVSLHQVLTPANRNMFDRKRLMGMKKDAVLINTARGALIDDAALVEAVESGHLRGAAVDVFDPEPLPPGHAFTRTDGILLAPHIGSATEEAMDRTAVQAASEVVAVLSGRRPENLVNPDVWERRRFR